MDLKNDTDTSILPSNTNADAQSGESNLGNLSNNHNPNTFTEIDSHVLKDQTPSNSNYPPMVTTANNLENSINLQELTSKTASMLNGKQNVVEIDESSIKHGHETNFDEHQKPQDDKTLQKTVPRDAVINISNTGINMGNNNKNLNNNGNPHERSIDNNDTTNNVVGQQKENALDNTVGEPLTVGESNIRKRILHDSNVTDHKDVLEIYNIAASTVSDLDNFKRMKVELFTTDKGPYWYNVKGSIVTPPVITKNLPKVFASLPIFGKPKNINELEKFEDEKIREFVGCDLADDEYEELARYCSTDQLKTGDELVLKATLPSQGVVVEPDMPSCSSPKLCISKKNKLRIDKDPTNVYQTRLKYRGMRLMPLGQQEENMETPEEPELEPGKDILYRVRVYRPYCYHQRSDRNIRERHSVFSCDMVLSGRHRLSALRDRIVCGNDLDMRLDVSTAHDAPPGPSAKDMFPSGFLFINNTFYVDTRDGCVDHSAGIRQWASRRGLGVFPRQDMCAVPLHDLVLKLGHPEVYVHQGNCEHVFTFSEVRLVSPADPPHPSRYPAHTAVSHHQTVYCTTCAEFGARWVVSGCERVPFDPAFFCDPCLKLYLYKDGRKIGDFRAYPYRGNEINMLKPQG